MDFSTAQPSQPSVFNTGQKETPQEWCNFPTTKKHKPENVKAEKVKSSQTHQQHTTSMQKSARKLGFTRRHLPCTLSCKCSLAVFVSYEQCSDASIHSLGVDRSQPW